jgi:hypothetical protein
VPSFPGLQVGSVDAILEIEMADGCVIVTIVEILQLLASVACTVYVLADKLVKLPVVFEVVPGNKV